MDAVPIGTIIAWVNKLEKDPGEGQGPFPVPEGWMKCDGSTVPHGLWRGLHVPKLNVEKRFLRGGEDSEVLDLEDDSVRDHSHVVEDPGHSHTTHAAQETPYGHEYDGNGEGGHIATYDITSNTVKTNINVGRMADNSGGDETRPMNMKVIWIIKAY